MKKEILDRLEEIEKKENVKIIYAVESGSRAWGVESPDSDYDVRFVYVRKKEDYLKINEMRDVIEWQLDEILDINGWDLKKTLVQFHKGNATLFEWANSPVVYRTTTEWEEIYKSCKQFFSVKTSLYHYYGTANSTFRQYLQGDEVKYKKYIYALRPILACKYIENNRTVPPVKFSDLLKQNLPKELSEEIEEMLAIKLKSDEKDMNPKMPVIQKYIEDEIVRYEQISKNMEDDRNPDWEVLNKTFLKVLLVE
ncbi:MAG: nucleotidyltransferase domain-containing protein [Lachnospiraceae bacterium]|nr:nucleotidyltransferase domain-containing protein [Lachnospiraceae bacterium]MDE6698785.1 nucleotidyltransferase domain-containing protein [Lachnospiraceae bacterium]